MTLAELQRDAGVLTRKQEAIIRSREVPMGDE